MINTPHKITTIVWDWNGTLLNDLQACVESINIMLNQRNLPALDTDRYRSVFGFPVKDYYEKAGFDFSVEPFDIMAVEFIDLYRERLPSSPLFPAVKPTLQMLKARGYKQCILSAMEQELLQLSLTEKGIVPFFEHIAGTTNHFATGKESVARNLNKILALSPEEVLLIGDTMHDHEVALETGWQCVLVSNGHQSRERLLETDRLVIDALDSIPAMLNGYSG